MSNESYERTVHLTESEKTDEVIGRLNRCLSTCETVGALPGTSLRAGKVGTAVLLYREDGDHLHLDGKVANALLELLEQSNTLWTNRYIWDVARRLIWG